MNKVFVLEFSHPDLSEWNGVFSTFEKAKATLMKDIEQDSDILHDFTVKNESEGQLYGTFFLEDGEMPAEAVACYIYQTTVDILYDE